MFSYIINFVIIVSLVLLSSTIQQHGNRLQELGHKREQWTAANIQHYAYQLRIDCFCPFNHVPVVIEVKDGATVAIKDAATSKLVTHHFFEPYNTIDRVFDEIQREVETQGDHTTNKMVISSEFDPTYGFPTRLEIDYTNPGSDANITYIIQNFDILE